MAEVSVMPIAGGEQTRLRWRENIVIRPIFVGRFLAPLTDRVNKVLFAKVIDHMATSLRAPGQHQSGQR
jgi:hypothetical protein